ncbi:isoamyl alcohol oxidase [Collybia nuda]|uniref:Isoamyl alcohol oxidase n=1 Tax=Collybia nuda TaxID=64659 RepID=A0A9P5Y5Z0_9AGAR|nr:isoamyl alcohol oxidase [Collybia nuda]
MLKLLQSIVSAALFLSTSTSCLTFSGDTSTTSSTNTCKCFPGDECWPSRAEWSSLNATVGGRLIATVPLGTPCHDPNYDEGVCKFLQDNWQFEGVHFDSSSSVMSPFFANQSCDPFQPVSRPCKPGNYVRFAINASGPADIRAAIDFSQKKNIRFVIRNTGHDYLGRSTGAGALAIWTHHLTDIEFVDWHDSSYTGPAVKLGAGVQGFQIMEAARDNGLVVVGGECPTVGIAGGYTQGGGHSALSTNFGLSVDNVLEWEVVTAAGDLVPAREAENSDLFWALRGGGGSTFGAIISMTVKAHPDTIVSGATMSFNATSNSQGDFYAGVQAFHKALPDIVDAGVMIIYIFTNTSFTISPTTAYNKTRTEVEKILAPLVSSLTSLNVVHTVGYSESSTYYDHYNMYFGPLPIGTIQVGIAQYGARFIPRAVVGNISETMRRIVEQGATWIGVGTNVGPFGTHKTTSVHPAWRDAIVHTTFSLPWDFFAPWEDMISLQDLMTNKIIPEIEAVTPGSGAYVNEADFRQPNFQETFWGVNYERLLKIKRRLDPDNFFYATKGVGSEAWSVAADGRLCRAS